MEKVWMNHLLLSAFGCVPARIALGALSFLGFAIVYMVRVNLSVAIVAMVRRNLTEDGHSKAFCQEQVTAGNVTVYVEDNTTSPAGIANIRKEDQGEMDWDEVTQGLVLSSFYYGYILTQVVGGRLAEVYGTRLVFGNCILFSSICTLLLPVAARIHQGAFIALRITLGFFSGVSWPSMHSMVSRWIPPLERSRFIAIVYLAATLSVTFTLPMCGLAIDLYGWDAAFYLTGILALAWCLLWFPLMHDTPAQHPRISTEELEYIQTAIATGGTSKIPSRRAPWRQILTSLPLWAIFLVEAGNSFGLCLFSTQIPTYMKNILGFSIKENGFMSGLPFLMRYIGAVICSSVADWMLERDYVSSMNTRRIFSAIAMLGPTLMLILLAYSGCNSKLVVALLCLTLFFNGGVPAGILVCYTEIAPNFAGTLFGIGNTFASLTALIAPVAVGAITENQQTMGQWQKVFWMCVPIYALTELFFLIFFNNTIQPWNYADQNTPDDAEGVSETTAAIKQQEKST